MAFTFFGVTTSRTPRDSMQPVARTPSSSFSSDSTGASPSPSAMRAEAAKDARLSVDIAQLMHAHSSYTPKDIADFLHQLPHLDPKMVGRVLGEPDELALSVLQEYANGFVFQDTAFDVAVRIYLGRFVLPGEAQKIDRILQAFAKAYYLANPRNKVFSSEDAVYTLAFSVVLLNTDAHNPHLAKKYKMGKDDFLRNHERLRVDGPRLSTKLLGRLYDSFATDPIQLIPRKPTSLLRDELELTFADGPLGLEIETSLDGRTCVVKRYALPHRHIYCQRGGATDDDPTAPLRPLPDLSGYVIVAVADDCSRTIGYALTRYLLKTAVRPVTIRFCEPSVYFESMASD